MVLRGDRREVHRRFGGFSRSSGDESTVGDVKLETLSSFLLASPGESQCQGRRFEVIPRGSEVRLESRGSELAAASEMSEASEGPEPGLTSSWNQDLNEQVFRM